MEIFRQPSESAVRALLTEAELPSDDITAAHLTHFLGLGHRDAPDGIVGLELYGAEALLRSLAVSHEARGRGLGQALVAAAERQAREHGVTRLYLLTTTAAAFFARLGYVEAPRSQAPASIQATAQFSSLCPTSSAFMMKDLTSAVLEVP